MANVNPVDANRGVYGKFRVQRTDGDPTGKHAACDYFVLDLVHDPHARAAIAAYAQSCASDYPALASDLMKRIDTTEPWRDLPADASPAKDPIAAAVDAQLDPLKDELKAIGHKLAKELGPECMECGGFYPYHTRRGCEGRHVEPLKPIAEADASPAKGTTMQLQLNAEDHQLLEDVTRGMTVARTPTDAVILSLKFVRWILSLQQQGYKLAMVKDNQVEAVQVFGVVPTDPPDLRKEPRDGQ